MGISPNLEMKAVIEDVDNKMERSIDSSATAEISLTLFDIRATTVGMKARMEAPADHRAVISFGVLVRIHRRIL